MTAAVVDGFVHGSAEEHELSAIIVAAMRKLIWLASSGGIEAAGVPKALFKERDFEFRCESQTGGI